MQITIGNGKKTSFWSSRWINGLQPKDVASNLFNLSKFKKRTVAEALAGEA